jgi:uncharacterized membrane protein YcaP (DUF421 family)
MEEIGVAFLLGIAIRTAIVFVFLAVGLRLTGRRQAGEFNLHDLLLVLILANSVQNSMTTGNGHLMVAIVSSGTLLFLGTALALLQAHYPRYEQWTAGVPVVLVESGRLNRGALRREGISESDLMAAVRDQGVENLSAVKLAILEVSGSISVIRKDPQPES